MLESATGPIRRVRVTPPRPAVPRMHRDYRAMLDAPPNAPMSLFLDDDEMRQIEGGMRVAALAAVVGVALIVALAAWLVAAVL